MAPLFDIIRFGGNSEKEGRPHVVRTIIDDGRGIRVNGSKAPFPFWPDRACACSVAGTQQAVHPVNGKDSHVVHLPVFLRLLHCLSTLTSTGECSRSAGGRGICVAARG